MWDSIRLAYLFLSLFFYFVCLSFYFNFQNFFGIVLCLFMFHVYILACFVGKPLRGNVRVKIKHHSFFPQEFFVEIFSKFSVTCFCNYFCWIFVSAFWLDFGIYHRAHNVFETLELVSFVAKFVAGSLELSKALTMGCFNTL